MGPTRIRRPLVQRTVLFVGLLFGLSLFGGVQGIPVETPGPVLETDIGLPLTEDIGLTLTEAVRGACDEGTKRCLAVGPAASSNAPPHDYQWWMYTIRQFITLDRDTQMLLQSVWPDDGIPPPVPLPPRPQEASGNASLDLHLQAGLLGVQLNVTMHAHADASASFVGHGGSEGSGQVPCGDVRGCPDLVVDGSHLLAGAVLTETFAPNDCNVREGSVSAGDRRVLRFTTTVPNFGDGDLFIGDPEQNPQWFEWGDCHNHWHFREYSDYRLWRVPEYLAWWKLRAADPEAKAEQVLEANPGLRDGFVAGHKQGFCVIDVLPYLPVDPPEYWSCSSRQGISRGWADEYHLLLDGQFVDVTGLPPGPYVLEVEANPERLYQEIDYANNSAAVLIMLPPEP